MSKRVVITGMGIYSCIGKSLDEVKTSLIEGNSGIVFDWDRKEFGFRSALVGLVERPILKGVLSRRERIGMGEQGEYAYMATNQALQQAGIDMDYLDQNEVGILYGNDSCAAATVEGTDKIREKGDTATVGSGSIFQQMNCTVTMNLSTIFKLKGINFTVSGACASGSHAIGLGFLMISQGLQDCIICGGAQETSKYGFASFDAIGAFSKSESDPEKASRPFDKDRDGLVPSGGSAAIVIESLESAQARGANILGELVGYGFSSNGQHISKPNSDGSARALRRALDMAEMEPEDVDYINAHATSTPLGDSHEASAIVDVFGKNGPLVSSTKSITGHECWMAGASEIVYSMIMMQNGFIAANINLEEPDEISAGLNLVRETKFQDFDVFLSNSFGFGGTNSSLIVKKFRN